MNQKEINQQENRSLEDGYSPEEEAAFPPVRALPVTLGGSPPIEDIIGRDDDVEKLWRELELNSIIMNETRRFGKTSMMRLLEARTPEGWICVRRTVQAIRTTGALMGLTLGQLYEHAGVGKKITRFIGKIGKITKNVDAGYGGAHLSFEFREGEDEMVRLSSALSNIGRQLKKEGKRLVIIWDEFPDAVRSIASEEGEDSAVSLMAFFRTLREMDGGEQIRWILTGSVGFHHVLRKLRGRSSWFNDMLHVGLPPLSCGWPCWMAKCLLTGVGRPASGAAALAQVSGGIPFVLELLVKFLSDERKPTPETGEEARILLQEMAVADDLGDNWAPLLERVEDIYGDERGVAEAMLDIYAKGGTGKEEMERALEEALAGRRISLPPPQQVDDILNLLERDHYLKYYPETRTHSWRYEPLRIIWCARRRINMEGGVVPCP